MSSPNLVLSAQDPRAKSALRTGWFSEVDGAKTQVVARNVIDHESGIEVLFERLEEVSQPSVVSLWMQTTRAFSLTATVTPCLVVLALKLFHHQSINHFLALTSVLGVLALQVAINVFNDVEDYRRLIDLPGTLGGSGVIQKGWWTPSQLARIAWIALIGGVILGMPALLSYPESLLVISVAAILGVLRYSARMLGLKYWALGDLAVWTLCGPALTAGFAIAAGGRWDLSDLYLGGFFGWMAVAILHVNNLQDIQVDKKRGVKTFAIVLGFKNSVRFLGVCYLAASLSLLAVAQAENRLLPFVPALLIVWGITVPWLNQVKLALGPDSPALANCRVKAAQIHLASGAVLLFSVLIAWLGNH